MNRIRIAGSIKDIKHSHECMGEVFNSFSIESCRTSGVVDKLNCIAPNILVKGLVEGGSYELLGQIRTRNVDTDGKHKLEIFIFVTEINEYSGKDINEVELVGTICKPPIYRETPLGREVCDLLLATNRERSWKSDYLPCVVWGRTALRMSDEEVGKTYKAAGRLQSREYSKKLDDDTIETRTAYEVSLASILEEG